jgi:predicted nucleic-acid-binding Zn-ribbon protein
MELIDTKSILAKLMATENLTIEQRNVQTASFDIVNRILTVPTLDNKISPYLYDLFMGHEVGHALYTPMEEMKEAKEEGLNMSILNVVEDSRIERKIRYKYPGLKNSFIRGYKELFDKDFFGTKGININEMNLIDRINIHCKGGVQMVVNFDAEEKALLNEVETTETYGDVINVSRKIIELMKLQRERKEKEQEKTKGSFGFLDGEKNEDDDFDFDQFDYENENSSSEEGEQKYSEEFSDEFGNDTEIAIQKREEIKSFTDEAFTDNQSKLFADKNDTYCYVNVPKFDTSKIVDYKLIYNRLKREEFRVSRKDFINYKNSANKIVSYLVKEFEMRKNADQLKRASVSKSGELNMNRIFSYQFSEDIFKKITVVPGGKSHGLVLFLDWSGSMSKHLNNTFKQLLNLIMFCKKTMIPYEVYTFISTDTFDHSEDRKQHSIFHPQKPVKEYNKDDLIIQNFGIYNIFSSRMSAAEFSYAASAMLRISSFGRYAPDWMQLSGTPLNEAVIASMEIIPEFRKKYKLQVVNTVFMTDGEGHGLSAKASDDKKPVCSYNYYDTGRKARYMVIRDPMTKNEETISTDSFLGMKQTSGLLALLRKRTNANVVGFYICNPKDIRQYLDKVFVNKRAVSGAFDKEILKFRKDKYLVIEGCGYNEYYALKSDNDMDDESEFIVDANATKRGLVSAFSKYTKNKINNRVVLNRFIGLIS